VWRLSTERHKDGKMLALNNKTRYTSKEKAYDQKGLKRMGGKTASPFGWGTLCAYVSKENQSPYVWGKYELSQILDEANAVARKKSLKKVKEKSARTKEAEENSV